MNNNSIDKEFNSISWEIILPAITQAFHSLAIDTSDTKLTTNTYEKESYKKIAKIKADELKNIINKQIDLQYESCLKLLSEE